MGAEGRQQGIERTPAAIRWPGGLLLGGLLLGAGVSGAQIPEPVSPSASILLTPTEPVVRIEAHAEDARPDLDADVIVEGSREGGEGPDVATHHLLERAQIISQPGLRDDVFRSAGRLPGVTQNGLSAAPHVRGGGVDELLVLLDGFPIRQPYHLSGYQSVFSLIDPQLLARMDVFTGGFPARFGGRMSGVFDMHLPDRYGVSTRGVGMSFYNASMRGSDSVRGADGWDWLGMGRLGTLGLVLDALAPDTGEPTYGDFVGRLRWLPSADREIAAYLVYSRDALEIDNSFDTEHARLESESHYLWLRGEQRWDDGSQLTLWLGNTHLENFRAGLASDPLIGRGFLDDRRVANIWDLRARFTMPLSVTQELQLGAEWTAGSADYDYTSAITYTQPVADLFGKPVQSLNRFTENPSMHGMHLYVAHRWDITPALLTETGVRLERDSGFGLEGANLVDPRFALRWALRPNTHLRLQWGRFHQSDEVNELRVQDGVTQFDRPQRSDHLIVGVDHVTPTGVTLRAEAFSKRQLDPRERFENLFDRLSIIPELEPDRVRIAPDSSQLRGVELSARGEVHPFSWWAAYTWSQALDEFDGVEVPRSWDQRHALTVGLAWARGRWDAAIAGTAHTGWPITELLTDASGVTLGTRSGDRVPAFFSVDMRVRHSWLFDRSVLSLAFELTNAFDQNNSCCRELLATRNPDGTTTFSTRAVDWLPLIPSLSVQWSR